MRETRKIISLAVPSIIANLTTPLLALVDLAIVGHFGSASYIGAIALGGTLFSSLYWIFAFLRMGTSGTVAQSYGSRDSEQTSVNYFRPLLIALSIGSIIVVLSRPLGDLLINFLSDGDEAAAGAIIYFNILVFGAPAVLGMYVVNGYLIGTQQSRAAMWLSIGINIVNIIGSLTAVYILGMGLRGIALGSLTAQWTGFVAGIIFIAIHDRPGCVSLKQLLDRKGLVRYFSLNVNILLRTLCLVAVTVWFTRTGASISDTVLAVNALMMQLFIIFSYFIDGFAYAGEALVGERIGAKDYHGLASLVKALLKSGGCVAALFTAIYLIGANMIISLLTSDNGVINAASDYTIWASFIPMVSFAAFIFDGIFVGATMSRQMLLTVASGMAAFAIVLLVLNADNNHILWLAFISYLATRSVVSVVIWHKREIRNQA